MRYFPDSCVHEMYVHKIVAARSAESLEIEREAKVPS